MSANIVLKSIWDDRGIKNAQKSLGSLGGTLGKFGGILAGAFSVAAITNFAGSAIKAAESAEVANNRLDQIASSMAIFGSQTTVVTDRLKAFADQQMMVIGQDDELIKSTQAKLLTFKQLAETADTAGGAFDRATLAAFDLASAGFGSAETNAVQLGKALQDPIKGIAALARSGVTFTAAQKEQIKTLVETNRTLEAQDLILTAIETQVGGTAAATVTSTQKIALIFGELSEAAGMALLPAVESVATQLQTQLVPIIQQLGGYLQSPEGTQAVNGFATAIAELTQFLINSVTWLTENWNWVSKLGTAILLTVGSLTALGTALQLAKTAQILFNIAVAANPYVLAAIAIAAGIGLIVSAVDKVSTAMSQNSTATADSSGEVTRFNNLKLNGIKGEIDGVNNAALGLNGTLLNSNVLVNGLIPASPTRDAPKPENPKPGQVYTFYNIDLKTNQAVWWTQTWTGTEWTKPKKMTYTPPGSGKPTPSPVETTADRFKKVQAVIQKAQQAIAEAERDYGRVVYEINRDNNERIKELNDTAAADTEALFRESRDRIKQAFSSATQIGLGDLFKSSSTRELETQVRKLSERLTVSVTKETEKVAYSSVTDIITGLRDRLTGAKNLLANASKLAGLGFKQTFIEQVLETGTESGNALAGAILEASPETQSELKTLFGELETVSETGADSLAKSIVDKFGLATNAMKEESIQIGLALDAALLAQSVILNKSLADAAFAFQAQISDIKTQFLSDLKEFNGAFAGLGNTIKGVLGNLQSLLAAGGADIRAALTAPGSGSVVAGATVTDSVAVKDIKNGSGIIIDELSDVAGALAYLQARIAAGNAYIKNVGANTALGLDAQLRVTSFASQLAELQGRAATGDVAGTVININVKADTTQSQAMVGKTIGNIVTKYVTTGGQVLVSGN
jgi:hypothetical protein